MMVFTFPPFKLINIFMPIKLIQKSGNVKEIS
jgi:hypothetical protein